MATDREHELVRGQVREVEAGQAGQPGQRGHQHLGEVAAAGVLPVLGQAVPQPVADYRFMKANSLLHRLNQGINLSIYEMRG